MIDTLQTFDAGGGKTGLCYSLPALEEKGLGKISRLPVSNAVLQPFRAGYTRHDGAKIQLELHGVIDFALARPAYTRTSAPIF